ncbi:phosphotransferase family protein [Streptomyces celluloflavus]|uniref:phosphotransferase family protein n=1 Tax=Streptomyces celluloflavus TaxID=58344 RepID=UPI00368F2DB2
MGSEPITLKNLPRTVRATIAAKAGLVTAVEAIEAGHNSPLSLRLTTATGQFFVKGLRDEGGRLATQRREYEISPYLRGLAPAARWRVWVDGWYVIAFDYIDGRTAAYHPGSSDLPLVATLLHRLSSVTPPEDIELRLAEQRLAGYVTSPADLAHFAGNTLLHTDLNPHNVLIADRAYLVDWGWATRGAAWLDAAYWVICLIAEGHTPDQAEAVAQSLPAWRTAPRDGVTAFANASVNLWREINGPGATPGRKRCSTLQGAGLPTAFRDQSARLGSLVAEYVRTRPHHRKVD